MTTPGQELAGLDFSNLIGGPIVAMVKAQAEAAASTINFITSVGLDDKKQPKYVNFSYPVLKTMSGEGSTENEVTEVEDRTLNVPILTIVPIPYLRIEEATIDFNANINSTSYDRQQSQHNLNASASWKGWGVKLKASYSYKSSTTKGNNVSKRYSMAVHVKVVQDEVPGGMERVLNILEKSIDASSYKSQKTQTQSSPSN